MRNSYMEALSLQSGDWGRHGSPAREPHFRPSAEQHNSGQSAGQKDTRASTAAESLSAASRSYRVLVVEDVGIVAMDLTFTLRQLGHVVVAHAVSGAEAVQCASDVCPDLVLMDVRLKGPMDGIEAAQRIRTHHGELPVLFLTAFGDENTRLRAQALGCTEYLSKPVSNYGLRDAICRLFAKTRDTS